MVEQEQNNEYEGDDTDVRSDEVEQENARQLRRMYRQIAKNKTKTNTGKQTKVPQKSSADKAYQQGAKQDQARQERMKNNAYPKSEQANRGMMNKAKAAARKRVEKSATKKLSGSKDKDAQNELADLVAASGGRKVGQQLILNGFRALAAFPIGTLIGFVGLNVAFIAGHLMHSKIFKFKVWQIIVLGILDAIVGMLLIVILGTLAWIIDILISPGGILNEIFGAIKRLISEFWESFL